MATLAVVAAGYVGAMMWSATYHRNIRLARSHITLDTFVSEFSEQAYPRQVLEAAFADFVSRYGSPVHASDTLFETLALDQGDLEDMLEPHLEKKGLASENLPSHLSQLLPLETVADYVGFLAKLWNLNDAT